MLQETLQTFLERQNLTESTLVLAVSGGVDSMTLLHAASEIHPIDKIIVAHINHNTRPECDEDQEVVQKICSNKNIQFECTTLESIPEKNKEHIWREARYAFLDEIKAKNRAQAILTAHHAGDLVETILFRLVKGCGLEGLSPFVKTNKPWLPHTKKELISYAQKHRVPWREDTSNTDTTLHRNLIRQNVIPELRKINPNLEKVFLREAYHFEKVAEYMAAETRSHLENKASMKLSEFLSLPHAIKTGILRSLGGYETHTRQITEVLTWLSNDPKGGTSKKLGEVTLCLKQNILSWA